MPKEQASVSGEWTRSPLTGVLSRSLGSWGQRMRLFQKRVGGPFYCSVHLGDGRRRVRSLGTTDAAEAVRLAGNDVGDGAGEAKCRVPLGRLWERYRSECETFRDTEQTHQSDTATRAAILVTYLGAGYDVEHLNKDVQRRFERARKAGGIRYRRERRVVRYGRLKTETVLEVTLPTRARSAEADLVLRHAMLNWPRPCVIRTARNGS
jgi:hypothetical protein